MKKATILFLSATAILTYLVTGCKNYDDDIQDLNDRLDRIENVEVKSVSQQIDAINASLPKLEQTDAELKTYIESLKTTAAGLEKSIAETGKKIDEVKASLDKAIAEAKAGDEAVKEELVKSIESAKASVIAQLNSAKSDLENRLSLMESTIATLWTKDTELETKINNLKEYVDKELSGTKDWATATFATIDQYNAVVTDISTIQSSIESLNASVEALENNLAARVNEEIEKALEPIRDQIAAEVLKSVQSSITETITKLRECRESLNLI
jgi:trimeric autotransporter adhesin